MSNDLISRSALMSNIENQSRQWGEDYDTEQILGDIEDAPTAYDVDKVVERLKKRKKYLLKEFVLAEKAEEVKEKSLVRINEIDGIIKTVKEGGVNE